MYQIFKVWLLCAFDQSQCFSLSFPLPPKESLRHRYKPFWCSETVQLTWLLFRTSPFTRRTEVYVCRAMLSRRRYLSCCVGEWTIMDRPIMSHTLRWLDRIWKVPLPLSSAVTDPSSPVQTFRDKSSIKC